MLSLSLSHKSIGSVLRMHSFFVFVCSCASCKLAAAGVSDLWLFFLLWCYFSDAYPCSVSGVCSCLHCFLRLICPCRRFLFIPLFLSVVLVLHFCIVKNCLRILYAKSDFLYLTATPLLLVAVLVSDVFKVQPVANSHISLMYFTMEVLGPLDIVAVSHKSWSGFCSFFFIPVLLFCCFSVVPVIVVPSCYWGFLLITVAGSCCGTFSSQSPLLSSFVSMVIAVACLLCWVCGSWFTSTLWGWFTSSYVSAVFLIISLSCAFGLQWWVLLVVLLVALSPWDSLTLFNMIAL